MSTHQKHGTCPPSAQQMLYRRYGHPQDKNFLTDYIIDWSIADTFSWFPAAHILIHKDFAGKLKAAFSELEERGLHKEIKTVGLCYNLRTIHGSPSVLSIHSWGCAIDLNSKINHIGSNGTWSFEFLEVMLLNGIFCGQNWTGRKVPDHFAMVNG